MDDDIPVRISEMRAECDHECQRCGNEYLLRDGDDPTPYCDRCAHAVIEERDAEIERLRGECNEARRAARQLYDLWPVEFFATLTGIVESFPWIEETEYVT